MSPFAPSPVSVAARVGQPGVQASHQPHQSDTLLHVVCEQLPSAAPEWLPTGKPWKSRRLVPTIAEGF